MISRAQRRIVAATRAWHDDCMLREDRNRARAADVQLWWTIVRDLSAVLKELIPMLTTQTHPEHELKTALERFETCLETPVVAGELIAWFDEAQTAWADAAAQIHQHATEIHSRQYKQIAKEDPELLPLVEKLRAEDEAIDEDRDEFDRVLRRCAEQAPKFEPDEERIAGHTKALVDEGIALVNRVRKQEVAVQTWFVEAFTRDRGVAD